MILQQPIDTLPGTSPITISRLKALYVNTLWDLLNFYPSRYENYSLVSTVDKLQAGETVTIKGKITQAKNEFTKRGFKIQKITVDDGTGKIDLIWYNQMYLIKLMIPGRFISASGEIKQFLNHFSMEPEQYELLISEDAPTKHTGKIVPVYPEKKGLSSKTVRDKTEFVVRQLDLLPYVAEEIEWIPKEIRSFNKLIDALPAYKHIHFPPTMQAAQEGRSRLAFDELFVIQLSTALVKKEWQKETVAHTFDISKYQKNIQQFIDELPFPLTNAQKRVVDEIIADLQKTNPMNRLVQGDVGSGKTVVAALCAYISYLSGFQTLVMAPTEILAQQHYNTISKLMQKYKIKIGLQTGAKKDIKTKEPNTDFDIIIGTHALLSEKIKMDRVGLVIIDEQHRFGVAQRALLKAKGTNPHLLTMTATPIPRTIALTLYGQLDLSVIDEMPKGRLPIKTYLVPQSKRTSAYDWVKKQIDTHKVQVFIICPLVEESEIETMQSVKAATQEYEHLKRNVFKKYSLGLLHGKMKPKEKEEIMRDFKDKKYDILVSTSVVEVGIDVPNATIMIIEGAQRYGLAQLHQLRGRVGRGDKQSYCYLFTSSEDSLSNKRLTFFASTTSGIKLAEYDLKIRGSGDLYGMRQHGFKNLKLASFSDYELINATKNAANYILEKHNLKDLPKLQERIDKYKVDQISRD